MMQGKKNENEELREEKERNRRIREKSSQITKLLFLLFSLFLSSSLVSFFSSYYTIVYLGHTIFSSVVM